MREKASVIHPAEANKLLAVLEAYKQGNFSARMRGVTKGPAGEIARALNEVIQLNQDLVQEWRRIGRVIGKEGRIGQRVSVKGLRGAWGFYSDAINSLIEGLVQPTAEVTRVIGAVARGDLSQRMELKIDGRFLKGGYWRAATTINTMVDQLGLFAEEVTRVAREVGTEGKLGGQAKVKGVSGTWKDLTDNVNAMARNLTAQVRNIAEVTTAVAKGDLSKKITVDVQGEILELKNTINTMVDQLGSFAGEVTRVAREVGTEGNLGGQAKVKGVSGTWEDLTDNVNAMARNLTAQVRNIAEVTTAVAKGDLSKKITVDVKGEILELKITINTMVDQLGSFAGEVTRLAREVGTEGKLGGQAKVRGVSGTWRDLTDNVNAMASNLTAQVRNIADVTTAVAKGNLSKKITVDVKGEILELKNTINTMVDQLGLFAEEVTRVAREVGTEGNLGGQAKVRGVSGTWKDLTDNVNAMAGNLTAQVRNIAEVTTAVAKGDLSKKITVDVKGEILELKNTINTMVDQLGSFAGEVTRLAREVGTEGKLGGQAVVKGVSGTWKDLTDNVNQMATNLTDQVRNIAKVVTAVANGDLKRKLALEVKGEIATLADTINEMIDNLAIFADQVTTVAREVGVEGKLGGQALVPGAAGIWKDLTVNVNQLAANLTTQVRAIGEVATAVTTGDLTRSITVVARGEVERLKNNINEMIRNLRETTQKNKEQDWLKTNLAKFTGMLQGQRDLMTVSKLILSELAPLVSAQYGVFYIHDALEQPSQLRLLSSYAFRHQDGNFPASFRLGEGLVGQCALEKKKMVLSDVPRGYLKIGSGLGIAKPSSIVILPILFEGEVKAVLELSSFKRFGDIHLAFLEQVAESIGVMINNIAATMRTEGLLMQSQALTESLQTQQEELKKTNEYKSDFLAKMSHELRTPLNSLLVLAKLLSENAEKNLTHKQIEFAKTMHSSGSDLLHLINDILDLSKIEAGKTEIEINEVSCNDLKDYVERTFRQIALQKALEFSIEEDDDLPLFIQTDTKRLQQILKNLLSNAFKFTDHGSVSLHMGVAKKGWSPNNESLSDAVTVIAFSVVDSGIGIPGDKHAIIFEPFQQAEGGTSRKYGGTGLGLSISSEIAQLLGGEIGLVSTPGQGSTFTLYLPQNLPVKALSKKAAGASHRPPRNADGPMVREADLAVAGLTIRDDRNAIQAGDKVLLIIEDNISFASVLLELARENGFKGIVSLQGAETVALAHKFRPSAITLDVLLPDVDGWSLLDRLKHDPLLRHVPVQVISGSEQMPQMMEIGAMGYFKKPVEREALSRAFASLRIFADHKTRNLLVVEENDAQRGRVVALLGSETVRITAVASGQEALTALKSAPFDCLVLGLSFPDMTGIELLEHLSGEKGNGAATPPAIVYAGRELAKDEKMELAQFTGVMTVKETNSPERLLQEAMLFLHCPETALSEEKRQMVQQAQRTDARLVDRKILIIDDDFRNIYAITILLERFNMRVLFAENGSDGISLLKKVRDVDIVLMDIMMPEMDGYETMRAIRKISMFKTLPIIALTAKAMREDRAKCMDAGASDYISKPVDTEHLISLIRVWLQRKLRNETPAKALPVLS